MSNDNIALMLSDEAELRQYGYTLGHKLDEGAYSIVKEAYTTDKKVAIKIVNKMKCDEEFRDKFLPRELEIMSTLQHRNIVQVYDVFHIKNNVYIVMEYAGKDNLQAYLSLRGSLQENKARKMMSSIVAAVDYLHGRCIAHRDLKCCNILLNRDDELKLTDFGFARIIKEGELSETYCGSIAYSAPEVLSKSPYNPMLTDIWGIGVITYMMVCGKLPYNELNITRMIKLQTSKKMDIPSSLSEPCKLLIKSILNPDVDTRIKLKDIITHPWFSPGDSEQENTEEGGHENNSKEPGSTQAGSVQNQDGNAA